MTYSSDWFSPNIKNWEVWLKDFKGRARLNFLEIGCFEGRATVWLLENILGDFGQITVIDTFGGGMEDGDKGAFFNENAEKNFMDNIKGYENFVNVYKGLSQEVLRSAEFQLSEFDFVYIDGSHRSAEVLEDTILAWRLLKKGGLLIWDDYALHRYPDKLKNPGPGIDAFLNIFDGKYEVISKGYQVCIKKVL